LVISLNTITGDEQALIVTRPGRRGGTGPKQGEPPIWAMDPRSGADHTRAGGGETTCAKPSSSLPRSLR